MSRMRQNYICVMLCLPTGNQMLLQTSLIIKVAFWQYICLLHTNDTKNITRLRWSANAPGAPKISCHCLGELSCIDLYCVPCIGNCLVYVYYLFLLSLKWAETGIILISERLICDISTYRTIIRRRLHILFIYFIYCELSSNYSFKINYILSTVNVK